MGSSYNWGDATQIGFKGFLSFDLSTIPSGIAITSVTLRVYQCHISGDPYGKLGNLLVEHVSYDTFVHSADGTILYDMAALDDTIPATPLLSTDTTLGYKTLDVTYAVRSDLATSRSHAQFRISFEKETASDNTSNIISWQSGESDTNQPELVIVYN